MHPPVADVVVVRHGDIGVKSTTVQRKMERTLRENLQAIVDDREVEATVERQWSRLLIRTDEDSIEDATDAAIDTFGVSTASPAVSVAPEMDAIREALAGSARAFYSGGTFAVRARRAGGPDQHPFTSMDIERLGGEAVWTAVDDRFEPAVDLDDPDHTFYVECRSAEAYVFLERRPGPGGLPVGSQEPLVALVSGGIDSPVAAWEAMRRGSPVVPVYFDFGDYGGIDHVARAVESVRRLARYAPNHLTELRIVPAGEAADLLVAEVGSTRMLSLRRFMFRAAERVARDVGACGLVTGEALGQKSSQTAANLAVTDPVTTLPVHRPLLSLDKHEIIDRAKRIGTYREARISAGCNRIAPDHPETRGRLESVSAKEPAELLSMAEESAERAEIVSIEPMAIVE